MTTAVAQHVDFVLPPAQVVSDADSPMDTSALSSSLRFSSNSQRSTGSTSTSGSGSNKNIKSPSLRSNLTRQHKDRDPLAYYEVTKLLGEGSMGSVARIRKRSSVIGGSARYNMQERRKMQQKVQTCFSLPLVGGFFEHCFKGKADALVTKASMHSREESGGTEATSKSAFSYSSRAGDTTSTTSEQNYAMKSIFYKHLNNEAFIDELKNEIEILKTLDHPHIVRVIETFEHSSHRQLFVVMELCSGGDLYVRDPYTEEQAARITAAILNAIAYMHDRGVVHRDLKYENS